MKINTTHIICLYFLILSGSITAQSAVLSGGGNATGTGSSSYSIGQIAYLQKGTATEVMEGVQVAYEIVALSTSENNPSKNGILLYPNPFKDILFLDFTSNNYQNASYQLFDAQGKLIKQGKIEQSKSELQFSDLPAAVYIIKIIQEKHTIKTYKIIKK